MSGGRWLMVAAALVVAAVVAAALWVIGPPSAQRQLRLDERRVGDLQRIARAIELHAEREGRLPRDLATLAAQPGQRLPVTDPATAAPYDYEVLDRQRYRLCAQFAIDTGRGPEGSGAWAPDEWRHGAGRHCFERRLDRRR